MMDYLKFRKIGFFSPITQICIIGVILCFSLLHGYFEYLKTGNTPWGFSANYKNIILYFAPIYEEIIFRGVILGVLIKYCSFVKSILISSFLFGLWHLQNIGYYDIAYVTYQIFYTGLLLGPMLAYITIKTKTIWIGVMLHSLNNFFAPISFVFLNGILNLLK